VIILEVLEINYKLGGRTVLHRILKSLPREEKVAEEEGVGEKAGKYFASGQNCAQAVIRAVTDREDDELMAIAKAFGGGVGNSKCLCGAANGGVVALALKGKGARADRLIREFREKFGATCCSALSRPYRWNSAEHRANCRRISEETAVMVEEILNR